MHVPGKAFGGGGRWAMAVDGDGDGDGERRSNHLKTAGIQSPEHFREANGR